MSVSSFPKPKIPRSALAAFILAAAGATTTLVWASAAAAHGNQVSISTANGKRCITSNGLPNHSTGQFPNKGNPNRIKKQNIRLCVTTNPRKGNRARKVRGSIGVGINGVQFRPGTADYYDANSRRGFSRNRRSGWNLDGLGARDKLGMDRNNAHVDRRGLYHYHGIASALVKSGKGSLIGWAADGFEIHYLGSKRRSGYKLKMGTRPSAPGGKYDGTYVQDWKYVGGANTLDRCNGGTLNGKFVYFATETFPFLPHCLWGKVSRDFQHARQAGGNRGKDSIRGQRQGASQGGLFALFRRSTGDVSSGQRRQRPLRNTASNRRGPPEEAISACLDKSRGASCRFIAPRRQHQITGRCRTVHGGVSACVPARGALFRP